MPALILAIVVAVVFAQAVSVKYGLKNIAHKCKPSKFLVAPDEDFKLTTTLENRGFHSLSFLQVSSSLPTSATVLGMENDVVRIGHMVSHVFSTYMLPRRGRSYDITLSLAKRGRYIFQDATLQVGDFLGVYTQDKTVPIAQTIIVYPRQIVNNRISSAIGGFIGNISVRRFIMDDPTMIIGFREYTGREPMKAISWARTAQSRQMMVKTLDYTTEPSISVILNIVTSDTKSMKERDMLIETCYELAHTTCRILEERGVKYDFIANATMYGPVDNFPYMGEGLGESHFHAVLNGLGKASYRSFESFEALINRARRKQYKGRHSVVITPGSDAETNLALRGWDRNCTLVLSARQEAQP